MSPVGSHGEPAPQTAGDVEDGIPAETLFETTIVERQREETSIARPDQTSDSIKSDEDSKVNEGKSNVDNEFSQVQFQKLDSAAVTPFHPAQSSEASPYCPQIGQKHSVLVDFGYSSCPKCQQNLSTKTGVSDGSADGSSGDNDTRDQHMSVGVHLRQPDAAPEDTVEESQSTNISYLVEYRDTEDYRITKEKWGGPFDLATARKIVEESKKSPIFDVVTILKTTISSAEHRYPGERELLIKQGILDNPKVGITVQGSKLIIRSQDIIKEIASVASYYPSIDFGSARFEMEEPYPLIAHYIDELEALASRAENPQEVTPGGDVKTPQADSISEAGSENGRTDLRLLLDFTMSVYKDHIKNERERYERGSCTFRMLWLLFKPGDTVYCQLRGHLAAFVVQEISNGPGLSDLGTKESYMLRLWNLQFDGELVGRCAHEIQIAHFEGERAIKTLKVFPCEYFDKDDGGELRRKLEGYGKDWYDLLAGRQVHYSGKLLDPPNKDCTGRAYVDSRSYYSIVPDAMPTINNIEDMGKDLALCPCEECLGYRPHPPDGFRWSKYDVIDPRKTKDLETDDPKSPRHRYLLCPREVWGLVLKSRTWEMLDVAKCSIPQTNKEAIQSLVMPQDRKTLMEALVQRFSSHGAAVPEVAKPWRADHMEGKGKAKSSCFTEVPVLARHLALLSLTSGDLGTTEHSVEDALNGWFSLAETWGAIVLIDEADVYLEKRQITDLQRNSLVSVFLRSIEYYRGILFLTTNRVGTFDEAFMSRIHVVIAYEDLGVKERETIWTQFFDKLTKDRQDITITKRAKKYVLKDSDMINVGWNGREIRNAFQTAVALADYRAQKDGKASEPVLDTPDFEHVLNLTSEFKAYLVKIDGVNQAVKAFRDKLRAAPSAEQSSTGK